MSDTLSLAKELISRASVTPDDCGCQEIMIRRLEALDFHVEKLPFGEVSNFWARRGTAEPLLVFAGHTDVVPAGPLDEWDTDPFTPTESDGYLYGRGAADMKGSLAAMITAAELFVANSPEHRGSLAFLITSDEEGPSVEGTIKVVEWLQARNEHIDWCLVGEPSSTDTLGDIIKNGRRGSLGATLTIHGTQGHVAYPQLADNPLHRFAPALAELVSMEWDGGNDNFPATSFQISNIDAGTGANNVIPGELRLVFNFRYSTETTHEKLQSRVAELLDKHRLEYDIIWTLSGKPFLTPEGQLVAAAKMAVQEICGITPELSTSGGTSDGRFIAPTGSQVLELGPVNATIHKVNECVHIGELERLSAIYESIINKLLSA